MKTLRVGFWIALISMCQLRANAAPKDDILAAINTRYNAMVTQNMSVYASTLADNITLYSPIGTTSSKSELIVQMGPGGTDRILSYELINPVIHIYGNTATANGLVNVNAISQGKKISTQARYLDVWTYQDGRWQLLARQAGTAKQ
ncbi:nuclear transport factor 2 family protein [Synechococcus sp. A10-1-5-9]|uniref:nuclear transport factor 2 family protein n=1 Tax=Synechococcus sp. A10-1-5-9 TaxID=3392295 RepID=UPI0039E8E8B3